MKDVLLRVWNTLKLPLLGILVVTITRVTGELTNAGDFSTVANWEYWKETVYALTLMVLPALSAGLDKWLREQGFYMEQIFNGFKLDAPLGEGEIPETDNQG